VALSWPFMVATGLDMTRPPIFPFLTPWWDICYKGKK